MIIRSDVTYAYSNEFFLETDRTFQEPFLRRINSDKKTNSLPIKLTSHLNFQDDLL